MKRRSVKQVIPRTETLFELQIRRDDLEFAPGNCVALFNDARESRPYSIAAGNREDVLRFLIRRLPGGTVSNWLATRKPGDEVRVSGPFGWFRPGQSEPGERSVFIATGTGIAPFLSYLRSFPDRTPEACFYGVRNEVDAFAIDELQRCRQFRLAVSREHANGYFRGRVTGLLEQVPIASDIHYYLCGLDAMIDETGRRLEDVGVAFAKIHREVFFHADEAQ